jgi:hypothetical protein
MIVIPAQAGLQAFHQKSEVLSISLSVIKIALRSLRQTLCALRLNKPNPTL